MNRWLVLGGALVLGSVIAAACSAQARPAPQRVGNAAIAGQPQPAATTAPRPTSFVPLPTAVPTPAVSEQAKAEAVELLGAAASQREAGQFGLALELANQAVGKWPQYPEAKAFLGQVQPQATAAQGTAVAQATAAQAAANAQAKAAADAAAAATVQAKAPPLVDFSGQFQPSTLRVGTKLVIDLSITNKGQRDIKGLRFYTDGPWKSYTVTSVLPGGEFTRGFLFGNDITSGVIVPPGQQRHVLVTAYPNDPGNHQFNFIPHELDGGATLKAPNGEDWVIGGTVNAIR